jgi:hypothetical protein
MLIHDGRIAHLGSPEEVGRRYLRLNFEGAGALGAGPGDEAQQDAQVRLLDAQLVDAQGNRIKSAEHGKTLRIQIEIEAREDFAALAVGYLLVNGDGVNVCQLRAPIGGDPAPPVKSGERLRVETAIDNVLGPGHYFVQCGINRLLEGGVALDVHRALDFVVYGAQHDRGVVSLPHETTTTVVEEAEP